MSRFCEANTVVVTISECRKDPGHPDRKWAGLYEARVDGRLVCAGARTPFLDTARVLAAEGVDPRTALVMRRADKQASIERRRRLVASGPLPPPLAARFTWGEIAVMRIVGDECRVHGCCTLHIDAIAARAGVHRTTVQAGWRFSKLRRTLRPGRMA
jgi:hypothetical protein